MWPAFCALGDEDANQLCLRREIGGMPDKAPSPRSRSDTGEVPLEFGPKDSTALSYWENVGFAFCCAVNRMRLEEAGYDFGAAQRAPQHCSEDDPP